MEMQQYKRYEAANLKYQSCFGVSEVIVTPYISEVHNLFGPRAAAYYF